MLNGSEANFLSASEQPWKIYMDGCGTEDIPLLVYGLATVPFLLPKCGITGENFPISDRSFQRARHAGKGL